MSFTVTEYLLMRLYTENYSDLRDLNWSLGSIINNDWYGNPLPFTFSYVLSRYDDHLNYAVKISPYTSNDFEECKDGTFIRNLWHRDVVEIFLKDENSSDYYEFHLSPSGGWWGGEFAGYREERGELSTHGVRAQSVVENDEWQGVLTLSLNEISLNQTPSLTLHISGILSADGERWFFSSGEVLSDKPDFHKPDLFRKPTVGS